jgi:hypothetical protein
MLQSARQRAQRITITHTLTRHRRHGMMCAALWSRTHTPSHTPTCRRLVVSSSCCSRRSPAQLRGAACSYWKSCPQRHAALSAKTRNTPMTQTQIPHLLTRTHARMHASTQARAHARARTHAHTHTHGHGTASDRSNDYNRTGRWLSPCPSTRVEAESGASERRRRRSVLTGSRTTSPTRAPLACPTAQAGGRSSGDTIRQGEQQVRRWSKSHARGQGAGGLDGARGVGSRASGGAIVAISAARAGLGPWRGSQARAKRGVPASSFTPWCASTRCSAGSG